MEAEFIPYKQALALKELGFEEECFMYWNDYGKQAISRFQLLNRIDSWCINYIEAPLFSQAFRWFREKCDLKEHYGAFPHHTIINNYLVDGGNEEKAELECLNKLIEIVKNK